MLYPVFGSDTLRYTVVTDAGQASATVTVAAPAGITVTYQGPTDAAPTTNNVIALVDGRNDITVTVTNTASETRAYTLSVIRTTAAETEHSGFLVIDTGWDNVCGLRVDHTISCQTHRNRNGWTFVNNVPEGMFDGVAVKRFDACGTRSNGELLCWDRHSSAVYQTGVETGYPETSASSGTDRCALLASGDIGCFPGVNNVVIEGPFKGAASARDAVCGLQTDGLIRCWTTGWSYSFNGTTPISATITAMNTAYPDTVFKFVAAGYNQACGIRESDDAALCWRWNTEHNGHASNGGVRSIPTTAGAYKFVDAGIGDEACGVLQDGTVNCWGPIGDRYWERPPSSNAPGEDTIGYETVTLEWEELVCGLRTDRSFRCWNTSGVPWMSSGSPWRTNSQLLDLELVGVTLTESFDRDTTTYQAAVPLSTESVTVIPELTNSLAEYTIYSDTGGAATDDGVLALAEGLNVINVRVVSADRLSVTTYTVTINRSD